MDLLLTRLLETFSLEYMFSVVMASYMVLKIIDLFRKPQKIPTWAKRLTTCIIGAIMIVVYKQTTETSFQCLMASFFAAVFAYDAVIKTLLKKLDIDYNNAE